MELLFYCAIWDDSILTGYFSPTTVQRATRIILVAIDLPDIRTWFLLSSSWFKNNQLADYRVWLGVVKRILATGTVTAGACRGQKRYGGGLYRHYPYPQRSPVAIRV